jgi:hypothetical protein
MKKIITFAVIIVITALSAQAQPSDLEGYLLGLSEQELSEEEIDGILLMREEEKLARDVYLALFDKWQVKIFSNISSSEQTHMDWVGVLIRKYDLSDPLLEGRGEFTDSHMKDLYESLVATGLESVEQAFFVGCIIEDLDIYDLQVLIQQSDNIDIQTVYQNLMLGSRNHMRAFYRQYRNKGFTYSEQYITGEELDVIISGGTEQGPVDHNGDPLTINSVNDNTSNQSSGRNYPNPFVESTSISFTLDENATLDIIILNSNGEVIESLVTNHLYSQGENSIIWNGKDSSGNTQPIGVYYYMIITPNKVISGNMMLIK